MDQKTKGAWLIHHTNKLHGIRNPIGYDKLFLAGKAGILLSAISSNNQTIISKQRLEILAQASGISLIELPTLINELRKKELIDETENAIAVLGVTTSSALLHTSNIFDSLHPKVSENAVIDIAERASLEPITVSEASEELSNLHHLSTAEVNQVIYDAEQIGFVDVEKYDKSTKLFFNGNLFRREDAKKTKVILDSLSGVEQCNLIELTGLLKQKACLPVDKARSILGEELFSKVTAIGLFDINVVSNSAEEVGFLTLPSAFSKFSNSMVEDAFDLAKIFVSSITYGMTKSSYERGQIQMVDVLLSALIRGDSVGPVRAIAEDYKILELRGVVKVQTGTKNGRSGPMLSLIKREVGELALQVIRHGDVSEHSLDSFPSATITMFSGPEQNRERIRKKQIIENPKTTNDMIAILRTGGGF